MLEALIVADPAEGGLGTSLARGFTAHGCRVESIPWADWSPRWLASTAFRLPRLAEPFRRQLRSRVSHEPSVDVVVVVKGYFFDRSLIEDIRRQTGGLVVCWNPDSPFDDTVSNRGAGIVGAVPYYDHYVTWSDQVAEQLTGTAQGVSVIPFGWDPEQHFPEPLGAGDDPAIRDHMVFVGAWTAEREAWLMSIADLDPIVFGDRWPQGTRLDCRPSVYGSAARRVLANALWSLNLLRPQNRTSHNMRTFEVPGCGGRELAQRSGEHLRLLGRHDVPLFDTPDELRQIVLDTAPPATGLPVTPSWMFEHTYAKRVELLLSQLGFAP